MAGLIGHLHFWLRLVLVLVSFFYILQAAGLIIVYLLATKRENKEKLKLVTAKIRAPVIWLVIGYAIADLVSLYPINVAEHVMILSRDGDEFNMQSPELGRFTTRFCDITPPFQPGYRLDRIVYVNKGPCWTVTGSKLGYYIARVRH